MKVHRILLATMLASVMVAALPSRDSDAVAAQAKPSSGTRLPVEGDFPRLTGATEWLNSTPLTPADLRGKVVIIDFWTYTCINWLRTLPYVRAWASKYKDQGLVVIGVHSPEFEFEQHIDNVRTAVKDMAIDYPVAVDSNHAVWGAFNNQYWPALYFIDAQGRIRHHQFGEGDYARSENIIQQLLADAGKTVTARDLVSVEARGLEAPADWPSLKSPENYLGHDRTQNFVSPGGAVVDQPHVYQAPARFGVDQWALLGNWTVKRQSTRSNDANGRISYRFHARDLHLVMGPAMPGTNVRFRVLLDGKPPGAAHGTDVDDQGNGTLRGPRLHQLIRQSTPVADRQFEIEFLDPGAEAFAFTFG